MLLSLACFLGCGAAPSGDESRILRVGNGAEVKDLDPHVVTGIPEHRVLGALFEGLTDLDPATLEVIPAAAERWDVSEDGTRYVFHLREDGRWSNGDPVTAHDFHFAWMRMLSPELAAEYAYLLHCIKNAAAYNEGSLGDFGQVGVRVLDSRRLEVVLEAPTPYFLSMHNHQSWMPVHRPTLEAFDAVHTRGSHWTRAGNLVSNGPFQLAAWTPDALMRVERNPHYWNQEAVRLDAIHFYPINNAWTEERAFRSGELHLTQDVPLHKVSLYLENDPDRIEVFSYLGTYYYRFNVTRPPFDDKRVRRAFAMALDRAAITEHVLKAGQAPAYCFTPPNTAGYTARAQLPYDPEAAAVLLAEAGYPGGEGLPVVEILYNTTESHKLIAEAVQSMWREHLGAEVRLLNQDWKVYLASLNNLDYMVARSGWIGDFVDPVNFLECFLAGGGNNRTGFSSQAFDAKVRASYLEVDGAKRMELLQQAEAILLEEAPIIPIYFYSRKYLKQPELRGLHPNLLGYIRWQGLWLEQGEG